MTGGARARNPNSVAITFLTYDTSRVTSTSDWSPVGSRRNLRSGAPAGSKGTLDRLGIIHHEDIEQLGVLLSGPSNAGLNLPGQLTAISLAQVTTNLLTIHLNSPYLADMQGMQILVDDIEQEFADASKALEQDDREVTKKWANQEIIDIVLNQIDRSELFSEDFFEEYSDFDSLKEFEDALPVGLDNVKDGDSVNPDVDEVVQEHSDFDSFRDLVDTAMEIYARRKVDLSEFDIDGDPHLMSSSQNEFYQDTSSN